jgi:hypothetical protein
MDIWPGSHVQHVKPKQQTNKCQCQYRVSARLVATWREGPVHLIAEWRHCNLLHPRTEETFINQNSTTRQSWRELTFFVLNSKTIYCTIIFENRIESTKFIK